jgi:hypothetical protein
LFVVQGEHMNRLSSAFFFLALLLPSSASAQDAPTPSVPPAATPAQQATGGDAQLTPAEADKGIKGLLLELDGKTPLAERALVLRNVETSDVIARLTSGEDGAFVLPELMNGVYALEWDGHVQFFEIREDRPLRTLKILAPKGRGEGLRLMQDAGSTLLMVGAGAGVAIISGVAGGVIGYNMRNKEDDDINNVGGSAQFAANPSSDFGQLQVGQTLDRTFTLRNFTNVPLSGTFSISGSSQFSIVGSSSFTVAPNGQVNVTVRFAPTVVGSDVGTLNASFSNAPAGFIPAAPKALVGQGTAAPPVSPAVP